MAHFIANMSFNPRSTNFRGTSSKLQLKPTNSDLFDHITNEDFDFDHPDALHIAIDQARAQQKALQEQQAAKAELKAKRERRKVSDSKFCETAYESVTLQKRAQRREAEIQQMFGYPHPPVHPAMGVYGGFPPVYPQFMPPPMHGYPAPYTGSSHSPATYGSKVPPSYTPGYDAYGLMPQDPRLALIEEQPVRRRKRDKKVATSQVPQSVHPHPEDINENQRAESIVDFTDYHLSNDALAPGIDIAQPVESVTPSNLRKHLPKHLSASAAITNHSVELPTRRASEAPQKSQIAHLSAEKARKQRKLSTIELADHSPSHSPRHPRTEAIRLAELKPSHPQQNLPDRLGTSNAAATRSDHDTRPQRSEPPKAPMKSRARTREQRRDRSEPQITTSQQPHTQTSHKISVPTPPESELHIRADKAAETVNNALFLELDAMMTDLNTSFTRLRTDSHGMDLSQRMQEMMCSREPSSVKLDVDVGSPNTVLHVDVQMAFQAMRKVKDIGVREDFDFDTDEDY